jgi:AraC-like DNA-binding protein
MLLMVSHGAIALLCLLLALHFLLTPARRRAPLQLLGFTYLLYAVQSSFLLLQLSAVELGAANLRPVGAMLLAPASWLFWRLLQRTNGNWRWQDLVHLVPALLTLLLLVTKSPLRALLDLIILASFSGYLLAILWQLRKGPSALHGLAQDAVVAWRYVLLQALLLGINLLIEVLVWREVHGGLQLTGVHLANSQVLLPGALLFLLVHMVAVLIALQRSRLLEWLYQSQFTTVMPTVYQQASTAFDDATPNTAAMLNLQDSAAATSTSVAPAAPQAAAPQAADTQATDTQAEEGNSLDVDGKLALLLQRWLALLQQEQLYTLEYGITLAQAARKLQVPARQLSNAINLHYGASFSVLLNDKRIAHAQRLLVQAPDLPVTEVMAQAGFASKSNFHKEFLRVTGTTPTLYRELGLR